MYGLIQKIPSVVGGMNLNSKSNWTQTGSVPVFILFLAVKSTHIKNK